MGDNFAVKALISKKEDYARIDLGYLRLEIMKNAEEGTPLNHLGEEEKSGILIWENEYIKAEGKTVSFGGGPLIQSEELDESTVEEILEKIGQTKKIGESS